MKLISWNVNGLRACVGKGFLEFFNEIDADFFCLQETKMQPGQLELDLPAAPPPACKQRVHSSISGMPLSSHFRMRAASGIIAGIP